MNVLVSHPTSNQNNRAVVNGLYNANMLSEFHTGIATFPGTFLDQLSEINALKDISRRRFETHLKDYTKTHPFGETGRLLASKLGIKPLLHKENSLFSIDNIYLKHDKKVAKRIQSKFKQGLDAAYAYEDGALHTFKQAKKNGVNCFYDLPIGYWKSARILLQNEIDLHPDWASTLTGFTDSVSKLSRKDEELALADRIFVASSFTAKSLSEYSGALAPIDVIPYGFPDPIETRSYNLKNRPLKLLFVGGLSQRKGLANMFAAVEKLGKHVELTVVGGKVVDDCVPLNQALIKYKWIPSLPHHQVLELMQTQDIFLFPSLFEGFGLVITEAMSQGTPVITTDRTAGPDLITHGKNGWLVEAGSTDSLYDCLVSLLQKPHEVINAGKAAIESAKKRPWGVYGKELTEAILRHK